MMELYSFLEVISNIVAQMNLDIEELNSNKYSSKRKILYQLDSDIKILDNYIKYFSQTTQLRDNDMEHAHIHTSIMQQAMPVVNETKTFTLEELSQYNGKNGNPAYIAVNGVVYDVTGNAAWAAANHFGLSAGNDLTTSFASCHAGSNILSKLPVVGNLI